MERCPICRARRDEDTICRRCGSDLTLASRAEEQALAWQQIAIAKLLSDDRQQARHALQKTLQLKRLPLALALSKMLEAELDLQPLLESVSKRSSLPF